MTVNFKILSGAVFVCVCAQSTAENMYPADVSKFLERRDGCDHFRGEEPYDAERRRFLLQNMKALCTGTDQELAGLKKKYADQPVIIEKLSDYEAQIELPRNR